MCYRDQLKTFLVPLLVDKVGSLDKIEQTLTLPNILSNKDTKRGLMLTLI